MKLNETDANTMQTLCKPDATVAAMHCADCDSHEAVMRCATTR